MKRRNLFSLLLAILLLAGMAPVRAFAGGEPDGTAAAVTPADSVYVVRLSYHNNGRHYDFGRAGYTWSTWINMDDIRQEIALPDGELTDLTSSHPYHITARQNGSGAWGVQCRQQQMPNGAYLTATIDGTAYRIDVGNAPPDTGGNAEGYRWDIYTYERTLVLSGTGSLPDYENSWDLPWYTSQTTLEEIIIGEGITHVNATLFRNGANLTAVYLPSSLTHISWAGSGIGCPYLKAFVYPGTKAEWQNVSGYNNMPQDNYVRCSDGVYSNIRNSVTLALQGTDSASHDTVEVEGSTALSADHGSQTVTVPDIPFDDSVTVKVTTDKRAVESVKLVYQSGDENALSMSSYDGTSEYYCFAMPREAVTLRVTFMETSAHKVTTVITAGKGSAKIAAMENAEARRDAPAGLQLKVYFAPDEGYRVQGVTVTNVTDNAQVALGEMSAYYPFVMPDAPIRVEVAFAAEYHDVTADFDASKGDVKLFGVGTATMLQTDQTMTFQAVPAAGCAIESISYTWNGNTCSIPVSGQAYSFTMPPSDTVVKVVFKEAPGIPVITATPTDLPMGTAGDPYRYALQATGDEPITWTWSQGLRGAAREYPPGLTLSADGVISGTPEIQGTWTDITITATNANGSASFKTRLVVLQYFTVTAAADPVEGGAVTGSGTYQQGMRYTLTAVPGSGYDFAGWVNPGGQVLSYHTVYEKYMGWGDETVTAKFVQHEDGAPVMQTASLSNGVEQLEYEHALTAEGDAPVTWSVVNGSLPDGLTLSEDGKISGTPTTWGTYIFTVKAENEKGRAFRQFILKINSEEVGPTRNVTFRDGGTVLTALAQKANIGDKATRPDPDPTKEGYRFEGWYEDAALTAAFDFDREITAETTVYAKFVKEYALSAAVDPAQGGTVTFMRNDSAVTRAAEGDELTVTWTPQSGYVRDTFSLTDQSGPVSIIPNGVGSPVNSWSFTMPASDVTATARCKKETGFAFAGQSSCPDDESAVIYFTLKGGDVGDALTTLAQLIGVTLDNADAIPFDYVSQFNCYVLQIPNTAQTPLGLGDHTLTFTFAGTDTYAHCADSFVFTVVNSVTAISLNSDSAKKAYTEGEALDVSGLTLDVTKFGGANETVAVTGDMISGFDSSTLGKQTLTVTYKGFTDTYEVEVKAESAPATKYTVTYIVVNGTWADGTTTPKTEAVADGQSPSQIPAGMIASHGYGGGAWSPDPGGAVISGAASFTYTFAAQQPTAPSPAHPVTDQTAASAQTGDESRPALWLSAMLAALIATALILPRARKKTPQRQSR